MKEYGELSVEQREQALVLVGKHQRIASLSVLKFFGSLLALNLLGCVGGLVFMGEVDQSTQYWFCGFVVVANTLFLQVKLHQKMKENNDRLKEALIALSKQ